MSFADMIPVIAMVGFLGFNYFKRNPQNLAKVKSYFNNKINTSKTYNVKSTNSSYANNNDSNNSNSQRQKESLLGGFNFDSHKISNIAVLIIAGILSLYLVSGAYIIQPEQQGIETRFGKYSTTTDSGLHYHLPYPIEKVYKLNVTSVNTDEIGYRTGHDNDETKVASESIMITKDENIVDVNFDVQWRINEANSYLFNIKNQDIRQTIRNVSESVMREIIGQNTMFFVLGEGRAIVAEQAMKMMQDILNQYKIGVQILSVPIKKIDPPKEVISAFRDVQSARADKEKEVNIAYSYRNDIIPRAKGKAAQIINEAESYYYQTVNTANGEVAKMMALYPMYKTDSELTKIRLYTDLMNDILKNKKIIVNDGNKNSSQINLINPSDFFKNPQSQKNTTTNSNGE
jgi:membrane protease subunit HflK